MAWVATYPFDQLEASINENGIREYTKQFLVEVNSQHDGALTALYAPDIPNKGESYVSGSDYDLHAYCKSKKANRNGDNSFSYVVTCQFSTDPRFEHENPIDRKPHISYGSIQESRIIIVDIAGNPILNSAKDRFAEPVEIPCSMRTITVTRNVPTFSTAIADPKLHKINDAEWNGKPAYTVMLDQWDANDHYAMVGNELVHYYEETLVFIHRSVIVKEIEKGWQVVKLDEGYRYLLDNRETAAKSTDGSQATEPVLLNGLGAKLEKGSIPDGAVYKTFDCIVAIDFSEFNVSFT